MEEDVDRIVKESKQKLKQFINTIGLKKQRVNNNHALNYYIYTIKNAKKK